MLYIAAIPCIAQCFILQLFLVYSSMLKTNLDCNYTFPIDLASNGNPIDAILIGKSVITIQIYFDPTSFKNFWVIYKKGLLLNLRL